MESILMILRIMGAGIAIAGFMAAMVVCCLPIAHHFEAHGIEKWKAYIPVYNEYVFLKHHKLSRWFWILLPIMYVGMAGARLIMTGGTSIMNSRPVVIMFSLISNILLGIPLGGAIMLMFMCVSIILMSILNMRASGFFAEFSRQWKAKFRGSQIELFLTFVKALCPIFVTELTLMGIICIAASHTLGIPMYIW